MSKLNGRISETTAGSRRPSRNIARLPWNRVVIVVVIVLIIMGLVARDKARIHVGLDLGIALGNLLFMFPVELGARFRIVSTVCVFPRMHLHSTCGKSGRTFPEIPVVPQ